MKNGTYNFIEHFKILFFIGVLCTINFAQSLLPEPGAPKSVKIPTVKEFTLKNGLKVAVVERKGVPLVNVQLLVESGATGYMEGMEKAGLGDMTANLLMKGTKTRSAEQIAEEMEFLGADLTSNAGWVSSTVSLNVMSDKLDLALAIMSDTVINPTFIQSEVDLLKSQIFDGLSYSLTQPGFLATYVASVYSFGKHPVGGTLVSIPRISREDIKSNHSNNYMPRKAVLIFIGDISEGTAKVVAEKYFGGWEDPKMLRIGKLAVDPLSVRENGEPIVGKGGQNTDQLLVKRILVIDLPNSGQAAVSFAKQMKENGRIYRKYDQIGAFVGKSYYQAIVLNSLLGGGYSSRLNQEIRIKRGLSYGAGSGFNWSWLSSDFGTRTQTKNESAAEVAELVTEELNKLSKGSIADSELNPRRLVLTGGFGRSLETNSGLGNALGELYSFGLPPETLNTYMASVMSVTEKEIKQFAAENFTGGDLIVVGDYSIFKDDLAKRFPNMTIDVIKADELDISKENLRK